ncbi:EAL domain-containing protein [Sphaerochaeta pleomorpha str. Grapes]|uniref:EAL domain-containing protein n=1 Tax=Sphaerochaeta pleomorpha (strain ATCC BAA-1885 / DSM 22778 / Grapes) TaxID=158190 RepID=G8QS14_SPHPG|nr:EAL domain-containing protein [Sphaerochaeta pleomorpha]AEV30012.1 EAL domain-containing protein [Sphaerochaeta pleomorpha str. Grapes]
MNEKKRIFFGGTGFFSFGLILGGYLLEIPLIAIGSLFLAVSLIGLVACRKTRKQFFQNNSFSNLSKLCEEQVSGMYCLFIETMPLHYYQEVLQCSVMEKYLHAAHKKLCSYFGEENVRRLSVNQFVVLKDFNFDKITDYAYRDRFLEKITNSISLELSVLIPSSERERMMVNNLVVGAAASGLRYQVRNADELIELAFFTMKCAQKQNRRYLVSDEKIRATKLNNDECREGFLQKDWIQEFNPFFQPIIDSETFRVVGFESMARWQLGGMRILEAKVFKDLAEDMDYMHIIDLAIIKKSFQMAEKLHLENVVPQRFLIVINISESSIHTLPASQLKSLAKEYGLDPSDIELDIKDSALSNPMLAINIQEFRKQGFRIALDVFDKEAFDLNAMFLNHFDTMKLNYSLYSDTYTEQGFFGSKIYSALVALSSSLSIKPLAKGIENKVQMHAAKNHGVSYLQGNYFSSPVSQYYFEIFVKKYQDGLFLEAYSLA